MYQEEEEEFEIPEWAEKLWFEEIEELDFDDEKCLYEIEGQDEVVELVWFWSKVKVLEITRLFAQKFKNENYFYIGGNLESNYFPRGIFQKAELSITLNGVGKYFIVTLVKTA